MKKGNNYKIKLIKILEILRSETDENHTISTNKLIERLADAGINVCRKTLYSDIDTLIDFGYEIVKNKGIRNEYVIVDSNFDMPELRILIDAVEAAKFISPKKSKILIDKISMLGGNFSSDLLKNDSKVYNTIKHTNEQIYYNINEIELAINQNKKISFKYFDYNNKKEKVFRKDGEKYYINPYTLLIDNDNYYLIGYNDLYNKVLHYRVDRMTNVKISHYDIVKSDCIKEFDLKSHHKQLFGMFTGEETNVKIEFDNSLIDVVIDKFGENIKIDQTRDGFCLVTTKVKLSPVFIGWCLSFGNKLRVVSPDKVVDEITEYLKNISINYNR